MQHCADLSHAGRSSQYDGGFVEATAESGSVVIERVDNECVSGTFDIGFANGDALTGWFNSVVCS